MKVILVAPLKWQATESSSPLRRESPTRIVCCANDGSALIRETGDLHVMTSPMLANARSPAQTVAGMCSNASGGDPPSSSASSAAMADGTTAESANLAVVTEALWSFGAVTAPSLIDLVATEFVGAIATA